MENLKSLPQTMIQPIEALFTKLAEFAPHLFGAILMLIIGYLIAKLVSLAITKTCEKIGLNALSEKVGIAPLLTNAGIKRPFAGLLGVIVFWMIMLTFIVSASDTLGLERVSSTIDDFVLYLPKVFAAAIVLLVGLVIAGFVRNTIFAAAGSVDANYGELLSKAMYGFLVLIASVLAVDQLEIDVGLLNQMIQILLLALALAVVISLGLGTRDISSNVMSGIYIRDLYAAGAEICFGDVKGIVEQVGTTKTTIVDGKVRHSIPNKHLLDAVVKLSP